LSEEWLISLLHVIVKGGFDNFAKMAYEHLRLPVAISDGEYCNLAYFPEEQYPDPWWTSLTTERKLPLSLIIQSNMEGQMQKGFKQKTAYTYTEGVFKDYPHIFANVFLRDELVGFVDVLCHSPYDITDERKKFVDILSEVLAIEFERRSRIVKKLDNPFGVLFSRLVKGDEIDEDECRDFLNSIGKGFRPKFALVAIRPAKSRDEEEVRILLPLIQTHIAQSLPDVMTVIRDCSIYMLLSNISDMAILRKKMDKMAHALQSMNLRFGVSNPFTNIMKIRVQLDEADFAARTCHRNDDAVTYYYNCVTRHIVETVKNYLPEESYIHPGLQILREYDAVNRTEYTDTLSNYLMTMCDGIKSAKELNIHRNTLAYRLQVIKKISGLDIDDRETRSHLWGNFYFLKNTGESEDDAPSGKAP
jgi:hypothetical protein